MTKLKLLLLSILLCFEITTLAHSRHAQDYCVQRAQYCLSDCQSFGNPYLGIGGCTCWGGYGDSPSGTPCSNCCYAQYNFCAYCNSEYASGDFRCSSSPH